jgi:hypothetical protein
MNSKSKKSDDAVFDGRDVDHFHSMLGNVCETYWTDWWTYEWCHRDVVHQFHITLFGDDKKPAGRGTRMVVDPNWSLGTFSRTLVVREGGDPHDKSAQILKVVDYYENGQWCDETSTGRKSEVHMVFDCCLSAQ